MSDCTSYPGPFVPSWDLVFEQHSHEALALLRTAIGANEPMVAPALLLIEVTNILRRRMVEDQLSRLQALDLLRRFHSTPVLLQNPPGLHARALELADDLKLPAVYDAHYLALAQGSGAILWTADERLLSAVGSRLNFVRFIGTYSGPSRP